MRHRADEAAILDDGAAAHALDDAAGAGQELRIGHAEHGVGAAGIPVDAVDLHGVLARLAPFDRGDDGGRPRADHAHLQPSAAQAVEGRAEDAVFGVALDAAEHPAEIGHAVQLPGRAGGAGLDGDDLRVRDAALPQGHGEAAAAVVDAVAEGAEDPALRVTEGQRADAGQAVAQQDAQHGPAVLPGGGGDLERELLRPAPEAEGEGPRRVFHRVHQRRRVRDLPSPGADDQVALADPRVLCRAAAALRGLHRAQARHQHALGADLDADGLPAHQKLLRIGRQRQPAEERKGPQSRYDRFFHFFPPA